MAARALLHRQLLHAGKEDDMLEFPEDYFDQEVREGFYIDTTMKTVWAAEMELLQMIAEVCDRHGLKWYAAYGTLLGAVRHEGFVPWDDDMDLWVKRADYNVLMKVLPKELPEGFIVRSPLTDAGYEQFHSFVCTGDAVTIRPEWLERFHGCPFVVGIDIFPLDYLPRDEGERQIVVFLIEMAGRVAQISKELDRGSYKGDDIQKAKDEVREGIRYLIEERHIPVNKEFLDKEDWDKLSSEMWKWANTIAMMYHEDESDYLVEFLDYIRWPSKKFPKEWFEDGYCAEYEGYMIPIPAEYDKVMHAVYGDYWHVTMRTGQHDYPYYKQELTQFYDYIDGLQKKAEVAGLPWNITRDTSTDLPTEWEPFVLREDGTRKKIILSANDPMQFAAEGAHMLDRLEDTFGYFASHRDDITLWWRPHKVMKKLLDQVSPELGDRYQRILDDYRAAGWGICDESDNINRAVEQCDAYYGNMNAILQPFQNAGKPVLLMCEDKEKARENNELQILRTRTFFAFTDFVEVDGKLYFSCNNFNGMTIVDKASNTVEEIVPFEGEALNEKNAHMQCVKIEDKIYFVPYGNGNFYYFDLSTNQMEHHEINAAVDVGAFPWCFHRYGDKLYLIPHYQEQGLHSYSLKENRIQEEVWWKLSAEQNSYIISESMDKEHFWTLHYRTDQLYVTNVVNHTVMAYTLPDKQVTSISYDGQDFWYTIRDQADVVRWNSTQGEVDRYYFSMEMWDADTSWTEYPYYLSIVCIDGNVFLTSQDGQSIFCLDSSTRELRRIWQKELSKEFTVWEKGVCYHNYDGEIIALQSDTSELIVIKRDTLETVTHAHDYALNRQPQIYMMSALLQNHPLLYEDGASFTLDEMCTALKSFLAKHFNK